ncbi:MAG: hypothetical protein JWL90_3260 [Chthoniobacteraceae bacterium]|nr:hypothetical protein [Chthoniobacteraceae bacterium]
MHSFNLIRLKILTGELKELTMIRVIAQVNDNRVILRGGFKACGYRCSGLFQSFRVAKNRCAGLCQSFWNFNDKRFRSSQCFDHPGNKRSRVGQSIRNR